MKWKNDILTNILIIFQRNIGKSRSFSLSLFFNSHIGEILRTQFYTNQRNHAASLNQHSHCYITRILVAATFIQCGLLIITDARIIMVMEFVIRTCELRMERWTHYWATSTRSPLSAIYNTYASHPGLHHSLSLSLSAPISHSLSQVKSTCV